MSKPLGKPDRIVVALGGNALGNTPEEQIEKVGHAAHALLGLIEQGNEIIITHGNGPQVGMIQNAFAAAHDAIGTPSMDLPECGAMSQGYIGYHLQQGIGREMHEDPNVPNFGRRRTGLKLLPGMVLAIEPMVNAGTRKVKQCSDGWLVRTRDGKPSVHFEKTVAITEDGPVVLTTEEGHPRPV